MKKQLLLLLFIVFKAASLIAQCDTNYSKQLIAQWSFNGNAKDVSDNKHNGTVVGAPLTKDRCGMRRSAYSFDGIGKDQYIDVANSSDLSLHNTNFTISVWIYSDSQATHHGAIIYKRNGTGLNNGYAFYQSYHNQHITFVIAGGSVGAKNLSSASAVNLRAWNHVVVTYNNANDTMKIYINGQLDTSAGNMPSPTATNSFLRIGNDSYTESYEYSGKIDDIRMYARMLKPCEIKQLYKQQCPPSFTNSAENNSMLSNAAEELKPAIYPNPTAGNLSVKLYSKILRAVQLQVVDIQGKTVQQNSYKLQSGINSLNLNTSNLSKGVYRIIINGQKNNALTFIKE